MSVHVLHPQTNYPWNTQYWAPSSCSQPGRYFAPASTQKSTYATAPAVRPKMPTSTFAASTFPAGYPQVTGYAMSATWMSVPPPDSSTGRFGLSQTAQKVAVAEPMWSSSWSFMMSSPPPHSRSLYSTIPLPPEDTPSATETYPTNCEAKRSSESLAPPSPFASPPPSIGVVPASPHPRSTTKGAAVPGDDPEPIELHPSLKNAGISVSPVSVRSADSCSPPNQPRGRDAPATSPSVEDLTLRINSTGQKVHVAPSSPASSPIVTVGDVLDVLEAAFMTVSDTPRGPCRSKRKNKSRPVGERISLILKSIQTWLGTPSGSEAGTHL
ncbi:hypothetical protein LshimejAT787_1105360 [Lyophyllum shimeji]|uniref:DUF6699 domain-containing protein n=1 Tax=Lyophyllum shimeji TaxID=47721 RepID=A0A9P3UTU5_LYOSH|nr:hypothetical protein LshimejAT787_1105360 [Lyophyllum shimeji]